jgi:membrane fusion protein (multidrug efflux system)
MRGLLCTLWHIIKFIVLGVQHFFIRIRNKLRATWQKLKTPMQKMLVIVLVFFGLIFGFYGAKKLLFMYFMSHYQPPAVTVSATQAHEQTWQPFMTAIGSLTAVNGTDISAVVSGIVSEIRFTSGQDVKQGDILILLNRQVELAALKNNVAQLKLAQLNFDRSGALFKKNVSSQAELDTLKSQYNVAEASQEGTQALIDQKTITAPFAGKAGIRLVNIGQYVSAGTPMVSLQDLDTLYVQFNLPEQYFERLYIGQKIDISLSNDTADHHIYTGSISAINAKVDDRTRNLLVQATIENKNHALLPGMYTIVKIWEKTQTHVITVPQTAISYSLHGDSIFVIRPDLDSKKDHPHYFIDRKYVKVGERRGKDVAILEGIKASDQVVTAGQLKLQNDTKVEIDNTVVLE